MAESVYQTDLDKLAKYGVASKDATAQRRALKRTRSDEEPLVLHHDAALSDVEPITITIHSVQDLKDLAGFSDELYTEAEFDELLEAPPDYSKLSRVQRQPQSPEMCDALEEYVWGNSSRVASYTDALNASRFPMQVAVYTGDDVTVTPANPLVIKGDGHGTPVSVVYKTITIEPGGQIIWEAAAGKLTASEMLFGGAHEEVLAATQETGPSFVSRGADGGNGGAGAAGAPGSNGGNGSAGKNNKGSCDTAATDGTAGTAGAAGGTGTAGGKGGDGNVVAVSVDTLNGVVTLGSGGGNGGNGGVGGAGGKGGDGGAGGAGTSHCAAAKGGKGGNGGKGGDGGDGGDGGNGGKVTVTYTNGSPTPVVQKATGGGGQPGDGGAGGASGAGGNPNGGGGTAGGSGATGTAGVTGVAGDIIWNGKTLT